MNLPINLSQIQGENFCPAPWTNLHINGHRQVKPCCGGHGFREFVDDEWAYLDNNQTLNQLKEDLLDNKSVDFCKGCYEWTWYTESLKDEDIIINHPHDFNLRSLDVRWATTCQLSCTYCDPGQSSTWSQLDARTKQIPIQSTRLRDYSKDRLWEFLKQNKSTICRIAMLGGEPLLLKENLQLLDMFDESVKIEIMTNLNVELEDNQIYKKAIGRENVRWHVSMENVGQRFEFVRRGSDWERQQHNIQKLYNETASSIPITIQSQYCVYSALNLPELYKWFSSFADKLSLSLSEGLTNPESLNFFNYPEKYKEQSLVDLEACAKNYSEFAYNTDVVINKLKDTWDNQDPDIVARTISWHKEQEAKFFNNRFNFLDLWPQYA